jgi:tetratricopeptide (TPR) repeat protein
LTLNHSATQDGGFPPPWVSSTKLGMFASRYPIAMIRRAVAGIAFGVVLGVLPSSSQTVTSHSQEIQALTRQAQEDLRANKPDQAAREFAAILALDPKNVDARGNLGVLLFFQNKFAEAAPHLSAALQLKPGLWKIQTLLGMCEKRTGQAAAAQADLEKSFPQLQEAILRKQAGLELIEIYYGSGDLDKAAGVVGILRRHQPADVEILYTAHRVYADLADETMLRLAMLAPDSGRMHQLMAHELARQGNREAAIAQYRLALKIDSHLAGLHFELAETYNGYTSQPEQEEAEKEYKSALAENPFDEKSECRLGDLAFHRSDPNGALTHYSRALQLQPDDAEANLGLAKILLLNNQPEKAQGHLEHALQLDPLDATAHYRLAGIYRSHGRGADADRELAEFQRLKKTKDRLRQVYNKMRVELAKPERLDSDTPK